MANSKNWNLCEECGQELPPDQRRKLYDPTFDEYKECICGHPYYRHFDTYEDMRPVGCKYCGCGSFQEEVEE